MHIAIVGTRGYPYVYSGYETFVSQVAPRLVERGHQVTVYCHRGLFKDRPRVVNGVRLVYVPSIDRKVLAQLSHSFLASVHVAAVLRPDVAIYVNSANGPFGWILKAARIRSAINVDGLEWLRPKWKGLGAKYFKWASGVATRAFDVVITDANAMADVYEREFHSPSTTIAYGANLGFSEKPELISALGLEPGGYYLVVGRLIPDNNGELVAEGFTRSNSRRKLVIVGDVPYRDAYAERIKSRTDPRLVFPGYVRDQDLLRELYCNSRAYFHGHEHGGTNPALLKALGYGCAIAALDTPFSREVLSNDNHGLYFTKNPETVKRVVERMENDEQTVQAMRLRGRDRITTNYTWEKIVSQYATMAEGLAATRRLATRRA